MKDTCKQEQKAAQTKAFGPKHATFVHSHNHLSFSAAQKYWQKQRWNDILVCDSICSSVISYMLFFTASRGVVKIVLYLSFPDVIIHKGKG